MDELIYKLKLHVIWALHLDNIRSEDIDENAPLFGEDGLGLESLDILELAWVMERNYGIVLKDFSQCNEIFKSVAAMAEYIQKNR